MTMLWVLGLAYAAPSDDTVSVESKISADEAEIYRLREEMNKFQESGALQYSERVYIQMLDLDTKQQWMTDNDHLAGAMASNARGDLSATLDRLERCTSSERAVQWRSFLWAETGPIKLESQPTAELQIMMGLLGPDQIAALDYANRQLKKQRVFAGRLPNGAYQYGPKQFIVSATGITMTNTVSVSADVDPDESEKAGSGNHSSPLLKSLMDKPRVSGGVGVASGVLFLGAGKMLETNQVFEPRTMVALDLRPQVTVSNSLGFASIELAARNGVHETTNALMFIPSITVGKEMGKFRLAMRTSLDIAKLTFHEVDYIKRSVGYTFGLRPSYCPTDNICIDGQMEVGILGSHSIFGTSFGLMYQR